MTGPRAEDSRATAAYFPKGSFLLLAYSQVPRTMGQVLTGFFPNRESPAINPTTTSVKPLAGSPELRRISTERAVTTEELIRAAPTPASRT